MSNTDHSQKFCVIGAGPSGLTVAKNLRQHGIPLDVFEREDDVGGNWYFGKPSSSVIRSTHLISSKRLTEYTDFSIPSQYPEYPSHTQALAYLRSYARAFDLYDDITFNTSVESVERNGDGQWHITLAGESAPRHYRGVVIANGHHWDPFIPELPGEFDGQTMHSREYRTPDQLFDKRVLVIGAGNSGCDLAVEAAQNAAATFHSMRRGYHFLPKFIRGKPVDRLNEKMLRKRLPLWLRRAISRFFVHLVLGDQKRLGLPLPDHKLFETHPIVNSQMFYYVGHGDIQVKPDVAELCGSEVRFVDDSREQIDLIVYATGFRVTFPFIDARHLNSQNGCPALFLHAFHPQYDNLFVAGLIQPNSGQWGLTDLQAQIMARYIRASESNSPQAAWFDRLKKQGNPDLSAGIKYVASPRHLLEVEYFSYRRQLRKLVEKFGDVPVATSAAAARSTNSANCSGPHYGAHMEPSGSPARSGEGAKAE